MDNRGGTARLKGSTTGTKLRARALARRGPQSQERPTLPKLNAAALKVLDAELLEAIDSMGGRCITPELMESGVAWHPAWTRVRPTVHSRLLRLVDEGLLRQVRAPGCPSRWERPRMSRPLEEVPLTRAMQNFKRAEKGLEPLPDRAFVGDAGRRVLRAAGYDEDVIDLVAHGTAATSIDDAGSTGPSGREVCGCTAPRKPTFFDYLEPVDESCRHDTKSLKGRPSWPPDRFELLLQTDERTLLEAVRRALAWWNTRGIRSFFGLALSRQPQDSAIGMVSVRAWSERRGETRLDTMDGAIRAAPVMLPLSLTTDRLTAIARHELGHVLGLPDDTLEGSVMNRRRPGTGLSGPARLWLVERYGGRRG